MQIKGIMSLIEKLNAKLIVLLCHHNADPDAVCAAYAFSRLLKRLRSQLSVEIAAAQGPSKLSKFLLNALPVKLTMQPRIEEAGLIVLLDTNTIQQLDEWAEAVRASKAPIIVIDHHASHPQTEQLATLSVANENASSTCEIVYTFFMDMNVRLAENEAKALFLGIAFDTRHFILASSTTLKIVADLIDAGVNARETLGHLSLPMDESERMARLKASKRTRLFRIGEWVVALSHVGAYQASAARALIYLGAHVAIVAGQRDEKLSISMRATEDFYRRTGVHLGRELAKPLGEHLRGMGGGHAVSAGANGVGDLQACFKRCIRLLNERLTKA